MNEPPDQETKRPAHGGEQALGKNYYNGILAAGNGTVQAKSAIESAKALLNKAKQAVLIPDAWSRLGLPGQCIPGKRVCSPFRPDRHPSFEFSRCGRYFIDRPAGIKGSVVDLIMLAGGCDFKTARNRLLEMAGMGLPPRPLLPRRSPLDGLRIPSIEDVHKIQVQRGYSTTNGIHEAIRRGMLWIAEMWDDGAEHPAWVVTDRTRVNAQGRKLDGSVWHGIDGAKTKNPRGCRASWMLGACDAEQYQRFILTEGPPDLIAAMDLAWIHTHHERAGNLEHLGFLCMTGASHTIPAEQLAGFSGKHVRICYDDDNAGVAARDRWTEQLQDAGATVDWFTVRGEERRDGEPAKDLCDVCHIGFDDSGNEASSPSRLSRLFAFSEVQS